MPLAFGRPPKIMIYKGLKEDKINLTRETNALREDLDALKSSKAAVRKYEPSIS